MDENKHANYESGYLGARRKTVLQLRKELSKENNTVFRSKNNSGLTVLQRKYFEHYTATEF